MTSFATLRWSWAVLLAGMVTLSWLAIGWLEFSMTCNFTTHPQPTQTCKVLKVFYDWQNAYGGIAAVVAAFIGGRYILRQIEQARAAAEDLRYREERAAKAVLPLALSELSQYARDCIRMLEPLTRSEGADIPADLGAPRIPVDTVAALQVCARHADHDNVDKIAKALGKLQLNQSRLVSWVQRVRSERRVRHAEGLDCMRSAMELHASIDDLFRYSRNEELVRQRPTQRELTSALHSSGIFDDGHPIWEHIEPRGS